MKFNGIRNFSRGGFGESQALQRPYDTLHKSHKINIPSSPAPRHNLLSAHKRPAVLPSLTIENYVKTIYQLCVRQGDHPAATGKVAESLEVSPGTVTSMLKTLKDAGLAEYKPYEGVRLTEAGRMLALRVLRRHRLIELFLSRTLELNWDQVHEEAENMEHAVSDFLVDRIDQFLDFPNFDPHGDPIPAADGALPPSVGGSLADHDVGASFRLTRVLDQTPDFLRSLSQMGLELQACGRILQRSEAAGTVTLQVAEREITLSENAAKKLLAETV